MPVSFKGLAGLTAVLSALHVNANAIPKDLGNIAVTNKLIPRLETNYIDCNEEQKKKLANDFADAVALAGVAMDLDQTSTAFTHYLRAEDAFSAKKVLGAVSANNDPTNVPYKFSVRCAKADDKDCTGDKGDKSGRLVCTAHIHQGKAA